VFELSEAAIVAIVVKPVHVDDPVHLCRTYDVMVSKPVSASFTSLVQDITIDKGDIVGAVGVAIFIGTVGVKILRVVEYGPRPA
jgi:hypothetical protein